MKSTVTAILVAVAYSTAVCPPLLAAEEQPVPLSAPAAPGAAKEGLRSVKGWELYSWQPEDGKTKEGQPKDATWHFSLLKGTNRNKAIGEVFDSKAKIVGVAALKDRLSHLAAGELVGWSGQKRMKPAEKLSLPPGDVIDDIEKFAKAHKLEFYRPR